MTEPSYVTDDDVKDLIVAAFATYPEDPNDETLRAVSRVMTGIVAREVKKAHLRENRRRIGANPDG